MGTTWGRLVVGTWRLARASEMIYIISLRPCDSRRPQAADTHAHRPGRRPPLSDSRRRGRGDCGPHAGSPPDTWRVLPPLRQQGRALCGGVRGWSRADCGAAGSGRRGGAARRPARGTHRCIPQRGHCDDVANGCPVAALAAEMKRRPAATRRAFQQAVRAHIARIAPYVPGRQPTNASGRRRCCCRAWRARSTWRAP